MSPIASSSNSSVGIIDHPLMDTFKTLNSKAYAQLNPDEKDSIDGLSKQISSLSALSFYELLRPFQIYQQIIGVEKNGYLSSFKTSAKESQEETQYGVEDEDGLAARLADFSEAKHLFSSKRKISIFDERPSSIAKKVRISRCGFEEGGEMMASSGDMEVAVVPSVINLDGLKSYDQKMKDEALHRIQTFIQTFDPVVPATLDLQNLRLYSLPSCFYADPMFANTLTRGNLLIPPDLQVNAVKNVDLFLNVFKIHSCPATHRLRESVLSRHGIPLMRIADFSGHSEMAMVSKTWEHSSLIQESQKDYYFKHPDMFGCRSSCIEKKMYVDDNSIITVLKKIKSNDWNLSNSFAGIIDSFNKLPFALNSVQPAQIREVFTAFNQTRSIIEKAFIARTFLDSNKELCLRTTNLMLDNRGLTELPPEIKLFKNLRTLNVSHNRLKELPFWISEFTQLRNMLLSANLLTDLPSSMSSLKGLKVLRLESNQFKEIPACVFSFTSLEDLSLAHNQLEFLSARIGELKELVELTLDDNQLRSLPGEIQAFQRLQRLRLSSNQLSSLPEELRLLDELYYLDLSKNKLSGFLQLCEDNLPTLSTLLLSENQFSVFPESLKYLTELSELDFSKNKLKELPKLCERDLPALYDLQLSENQFSVFPENLEYLSALSRLDLSKNKLSHFPAEFKKLTQLTKLKLEDNEIILDSDAILLLTTYSYPLACRRIDIDLRKNPIPEEIQRSIRDAHFPSQHYLNGFRLTFSIDEN